MIFLKVLILDDEDYMLDYLENLIDWSHFGMTKVTTSDDTHVAMEILNKNTTDLLITDIRMPEKSGLDIIREVKQKNLKTEVIIFSGYSEFKYAQEAIKYGALDYLLKPVTKEILQESLQKVRESILNKNQLQLLREKKESQLLNYFLQGLRGTLSEKPNEAKYCFIAVLNLSHLILDREFLFLGQNGIEKIYCMTVTESKSLENKIKKKSASFQLTDIGTVQSAFFSFFFDWEGKLGESRKGFLHAINSSKLPKTSFQCELNKCDWRERTPFVVATFVCLELSQQKKHRVDQFMGILTNEKEIYQLTSKLFEKYCSDYQGLTTAEQIVNDVKTYVKHHKLDDLNVNALAELLYLSPSYLSKVFKSVTGENISNYIVRKKMVEAAHLLEQTELKVSEIGSRLGYRKSQYFIKIFKDHYHKTPQNYRRELFKNRS